MLLKRVRNGYFLNSLGLTKQENQNQKLINVVYVGVDLQSLINLLNTQAFNTFAIIEEQTLTATA